ncbi:MAG: hypothetical protein JKY51_07845 [Opitutaceae bacterium]|nr:hypothetical protein [Opitutaceae bacterium]
MSWRVPSTLCAADNSQGPGGKIQAECLGHQQVDTTAQADAAKSHDNPLAPAAKICVGDLVEDFCAQRRSQHGARNDQQIDPPGKC